MSFKHMGTENLCTERLLLRRFEYDDTDYMLKNWIANPAVQHNYGEPIYKTSNAVRKLLDKWIGQYDDLSFYRWAIILKETNENIGQIAFCRVYTEHKIAEIEYCVGENYWGNGYVAEALKAVMKYSFEKPHFDKLEAFHNKTNPNSGRVLQKTGFIVVDNVLRFSLINKINKQHIYYAIDKSIYDLGDKNEKHKNII